MKDPNRVLGKQGPKTPHPDMLRFAPNEQVVKLRPVIVAKHEGIVGLRRSAGIKPAKAPRVIELPDELLQVLGSDAILEVAFKALTPGRQQSYVLAINGAKKRESRMARIAKFRDRIIAGKGAMER